MRQLLAIFLLISFPALAQDQSDLDAVIAETITELEAEHEDLTRERIAIEETMSDSFYVVRAGPDGSVIIEERADLLRRIRAAAVVTRLMIDARGNELGRTLEIASLLFDLPTDLLAAATIEFDPDRYVIAPDEVEDLLLHALNRYVAAQAAQVQAVLEGMEERIEAIADARDELEALLQETSEELDLPDTGAGYDVPANRGGWLHDQIQVLGTTRECGGGLGCCAEYRGENMPPAGVSYYSVDDICFTCTPPYSFGLRGVHEYPTCFVHQSRVND